MIQSYILFELNKPCELRIINSMIKNVNMIKYIRGIFIIYNII